jgi:hypothetical protein
MNDLERELRIALARRNPPAPLEEKVLERLDKQTARPFRRWLAVAAVVILMLASVLEHERRRRVEQETAGQELIRAMEIVNTKLDSARQRVIELGDSTWELERKSLQH